MTKPRFIDAHIHLWDLDRISYPWLTPPFSGEGVAGSVEAIARTYLLNDYLADAADWAPAGAVHIDAGAAPELALAETQWLQAMADERGLPSAIVAYAPLNEPDVERLLATHAEHANVRGIRQILNWHPDPGKTYTPRDLLDGDMDFEAGYGLLAKYGLSFDLQIYPSQMAAAARLAARHPGTPVILNHAGMPVERDQVGVALWREGMRALAAQPNVSTKISGFGIVDHRWTVDGIRPLVLEAIDIFGTDRCMFASDFPTDRLFGAFSDHLGAYDLITSDFTDGERAKLFADNAERIYRLA